MVKKSVLRDGLQRLLGLRHYDAGSVDPEPIFIGLDIEAGRPERNEAHEDHAYQPFVREIGLAFLDSRDLAHDTGSSPRTTIRSEGFRVHCTDEEQTYDSVCISCVGELVRQAIEIEDAKSNVRRWRNIVIVGQSPQGDITLLRNLGLDLDGLEMKYQLLDTHYLANEILPKTTESGGKVSWRLKSIMLRLGCPLDHKSFHGAENDARHHLHLMVKLGFRDFDDNHQGQAMLPPISDGPDGSAPSPQQVFARTRARLQEWYLATYGGVAETNGRGSGSQVPSSRRQFRGRPDADADS